MKQNRESFLEQIGFLIPEDEISSETWERIAIGVTLSEGFIREFKDELNWQNISKFQNLSPKFINEFEDMVDWYLISKFQKLSEDFIRKNKKNVYWPYICQYQELTEGFLREFQDKVVWGPISCNVIFTNYFLHEFKNKLEWGNYFKYRNADYLIIKQYIAKTNYKNVNEFEISHLNNAQKQEIQKILDIKNMFKK